ncbi:MAG: ribose ABC transporter permease [Spirochaetes bacterium]|nr:MAG: ribose ABC transporter permease [Spirochaetota bacterium]
MIKTFTGVSLVKSSRVSLGRYFALLLLIGIAAFMAPGFLTLQNILNLLRSFSFLGFISIGMTFVILSAGLDLSVASLLALCSVLTALFQHWGIYLGHTTTLSYIFPFPFILITVLLIGSFLGFLNGIVITKLKITDFVSTLGMMVFARGLAFAISGGRSIFEVGAETLFMGRGMVGIIPFVACLWVFAIMFCTIVLKYTAFGQRLYVSGENPEAARLSGVDPHIYKIAAYTISGFFAALAGVCMTGRLNVGEPRVAQGWELDAIAAVVIGGTSFAGGQGSVVKTILGVAIIGLIRNILSLLGILPSPQQMIMGLVLLFAVILQRLGERNSD